MSRRKDARDQLASGPIGPWRLALVMLAVASTSGAALLQSARTGVDLDLAMGRALAVAVVLWLLLGSIDRVLARAQLRHAEEIAAAIDAETADTLAARRGHS